MTWPAKIRIMISVTVVMGIAEFFMLRSYILKGSLWALYGSIVMTAVWAAHIIVFCFVIKTCPRERALQITREGKEPAYDAE